MNRRSALLLMELLVMVLVFSLAAAACLGIFAEARLMARETARLDAAVLLARNTAELLKAGRPIPTSDALEVRELPTDIPGWKTVRITVVHEKTPVFSLDTGWQEAIP